ncbi:unnamed protein product [Mucor circinelloides]|uniref:Uncharacterized protein n=1 Tax=Mucor circinelloides f. circinelloides (strain 1006PhL) TaxID=1220926 RepID=S2JLV3_MUCC1|nr:hypothetical protein HMPREF1544_09699 [Mucor circinelloides 1006PhL]KAG1089252.1 hypothetical protein G6F42_020026 [Rhizopus arrhizus]
MVRATIFVSALFALAATVSAIPRPDASLVGVDGGDHIGTGDLNFDEALQNVVNANDLQVQDVGYDINAIADDDDDNNSGSNGSGCGDHHHHGGLLHGLLKREEAPAGTVRIARQNKKGNKMMNSKSKKAAAAAAAAVKMA